MKPHKPVLLILGAPPDPWFNHLSRVSEHLEVLSAHSAEDAESMLPEAEIVFSWEKAGRWLKTHWDQARNLKWVQSSSAGVEHLLFPQLVESPVVLTNGRGIYAEPLGEFVMFCVLFFAKDFPTMDRNRLARRWRNYEVREIQNQTLGIVGLGGTGRVVARMAKSFQMRVLATKRNVRSGAEEDLVDALIPVESWHELLGQSDYVVNTLPVTPQSRDMFDESAFRAMKSGACFINVGRGDTVDEDALLRALREGWIAGAGLDVFKTEPLPAGSEFYALPNVILSPHCADITPDYSEKSARLLADNIERYLNSKPLLKIVDKRRGY